MRFNKKKEEYITDKGNVTDKLKIKCARKHFEALGEEIAFMAPESSPDEFMEKAQGLQWLKFRKCDIQFK